MLCSEVKESMGTEDGTYHLPSEGGTFVDMVGLSDELMISSYSDYVQDG